MYLACKMNFQQRYKRNFGKGWFFNSWKHSLAAKGIKTRPIKYQYRVEESPEEKSLRMGRGYKYIVTIDAKKFADRFKESQDEDLKWSDFRLQSAKGRDVVDSYPQIDFYSDGYVDVQDGRHRLAVAAEKGLKVPVAIKRLTKFMAVKKGRSLSDELEAAMQQRASMQADPEMAEFLPRLDEEISRLQEKIKTKRRPIVPIDEIFEPQPVGVMALLPAKVTKETKRVMDQKAFDVEKAKMQRWAATRERQRVVAREGMRKVKVKKLMAKKDFYKKKVVDYYYRDDGDGIRNVNDIYIPITRRPTHKSHIYPIKVKDLKSILDNIPTMQLVGLSEFSFRPPSRLSFTEQSKAWAQYADRANRVNIYSEPYKVTKKGLRYKRASERFDEYPELRAHMRKFIIPHELGHHHALDNLGYKNDTSLQAEARADAIAFGRNPHSPKVMNFFMARRMR